MAFGSLHTEKTIRIIVILVSIGSAVRGTEPAGKAVLEAAQSTGIRLSDKARKTIEIQTVSIQSEGTHNLPLSGIVYYQDKVGVYRLRQGWFKLVELVIIKKSASECTVRSPELKQGDDVVVHGAALLRVAEMEAFGGEQ